MPMFINTNTAGLNAQRSLTLANNSLQTSLERLSSGRRINSAKDDAAGLGISERMTTQITGLNQAARNAQDAISLTQVAEGALGEISKNLQRIRELAVQSANATNSAGDRAVLDQEVQQRLWEIDRIATQTNFNGQKVLDGTFGTSTFQVGANAGETVSLNLSQSARTSALGRLADYAGGAAYSSSNLLGGQGSGVDTNAIVTGDVTIAVGSGSAMNVAASGTYAGTGAGQGAASAFAKAAAINASGISGVTASASTDVKSTFATVQASTYSLTINGTAIYTSYNASAAANNITGTSMAQAINSNTSTTGVAATFDSTSGVLTLSAADGRDVTIIQSSNSTGATSGGIRGLVAGQPNNNSTNITTGTVDVTTGGTPVTKTYAGTVRLTSAQAMTVGGSNIARIGATATMAVGTTGISSGSVTTVANANQLMGMADSALDTVSILRGTLGAMGTRIESTISSLLVNSENLQASRSRVLDTDYAAETANLTKSQVMQQASTAILSQANAVPQTVLSLLK